jgi:hypothetical protein
MDDRLQRRLEGADPLAAGVGTTPDPARLDAIKEQIMLTDPAPARSALRPRAIGLVGLTAASLAVVLVAGSLLRPTPSLAWDPSPTAATAAQRDAATKACGTAVSSATLKASDPQGQPLPVPSGLPVINVGSNGPIVVQASAGAGGDGQITVTTGQASTGDTAPVRPALPTELPPLVGLELHGTGAVAIFADAKTTAYCLLAKDGDGFAMAALIFPDLGNGMSAAVGSIGEATSASGMAMAAVGGGTGFSVSALTAEYKGQKVGIIAGYEPNAAVRARVVGGPADGASATITDGRFAMWAPDASLDADTKLETLDASGKVVDSFPIGMPPMPSGAVTTTLP